MTGCKSLSRQKLIISFTRFCLSFIPFLFSSDSGSERFSIANSFFQILIQFSASDSNSVEFLHFAVLSFCGVSFISLFMDSFGLDISGCEWWNDIVL